VIKRIVLVMVLFSGVACNSESSIDKTVDSTKEVIDSQKYVTKDSVTHKADSNKHIIDSSMQVLKDSMKNTK